MKFWCNIIIEFTEGNIDPVPGACLILSYLSSYLSVGGGDLLWWKYGQTKKCVAKIINANAEIINATVTPNETTPS